MNNISKKQRILSERSTPPLRLPHHSATLRLLRAVAIFEAVKGALAIAVVLGLMKLLHRDIVNIVTDMIGRFGINPHAPFPSFVMHAAVVLANANLRVTLILALFYALVRWTEAYGLWYQRRWGEWLGVLSGAIYLPTEWHHLLKTHSLTSIAIILANVAIVLLLVYRLWQRRRHPALENGA